MIANLENASCDYSLRTWSGIAASNFETQAYGLLDRVRQLSFGSHMRGRESPSAERGVRHT